MRKGILETYVKLIVLEDAAKECKIEKTEDSVKSIFKYNQMLVLLAGRSFEWIL
jgi:hypothetical protein